MNNSVVIVGERGWVEVAEGIRGINGMENIQLKKHTNQELIDF